LNIKARYSSDSYGDHERGIIEEFFIPCLKNSEKYDSVSAFYSSYVLVYLFQGIKEFIKNKGTMRLILGCIPSQEFQVVNDIQRKRKYEEDFINRILTDEKIEEKDLKKSILKLFAWLIDRGHLKIKLGFIINEKGKLASEKEIKITLRYGMLHDKTGIFIDNEGKSIAFSGSLNETTKGLLKHADSITTYKSWKIYDGEENNEYFSDIHKEFNRFWHNKGKRIKVFSLPDEKLTSIIKFAPKDFPEEDYRIINTFYRRTEKEVKIFQEFSREEEDKPPLDDILLDPFGNINWYEPQRIGYESWMNNNKRGILAIATGVGKTLIALRILYEFLNKDTESKKLILIVVPDNLALQWKEELEKWILSKVQRNFVNISFLITFKAGMPIKTKLVLLKKELDVYQNHIIIAYYNTFSKSVIPLINNDNKHSETLLIADEVHEMGTKKRIERFSLFNPDYRLGLSATPIRKFDTEGTDFIENYFSKTVYHYKISEAIRDHYLCPYNYIPYFYELTDAELEAYNDISKKIFAIDGEIKKAKDPKSRKKLRDDKDLQQIIRKRVIKLAENKLPILNKILEDLIKKDEIYYTLVYVEDKEQLTPVIKILENLNIRYAKILQEVDPDSRQDILKAFEKKQVQVILAEKIFDQGVNVEALKNGIILSSTVNERQYIQRRGRLLRKHHGKEFAKIYDFISLEKSVLGELIRANIFYNDCSNKEEVRNQFLAKNIKLEDVMNNE